MGPLFSLFVSLHVYIETELSESEQGLSGHCVLFLSLSKSPISFLYGGKKQQFCVLDFPPRSNKPVHPMEFSF